MLSGSRLESRLLQYLVFSTGETFNLSLVVSVSRISRRWTGGLADFFFSPAAGGLAKSMAAKPKIFFGRLPAANSTAYRYKYTHKTVTVKNTVISWTVYKIGLACRKFAYTLITRTNNCTQMNLSQSNIPKVSYNFTQYVLCTDQLSFTCMHYTHKTLSINQSIFTHKKTLISRTVYKIACRKFANSLITCELTCTLHACNKR